MRALEWCSQNDHFSGLAGTCSLTGVWGLMDDHFRLCQGASVWVSQDLGTKLWCGRAAGLNRAPGHQLGTECLDNQRGDSGGWWEEEPPGNGGNPFPTGQEDLDCNCLKRQKVKKTKDKQTPQKNKRKRKKKAQKWWKPKKTKKRKEKTEKEQKGSRNPPRQKTRPKKDHSKKPKPNKTQPPPPRKTKR